MQTIKQFNNVSSTEPYITSPFYQKIKEHCVNINESTLRTVLSGCCLDFTNKNTEIKRD